MSARDRKSLWDYAVHSPGPPLSGHVLVGVDGSQEAGRALDRAAAEARTRLAPLEILHAWPWAGHAAGPGADDPRSRVDRARDVLEDAAARVREHAPELEVIQTLSPEPAATELVRRGDRAALTVLGSRGSGRVAEVLARSVTLRAAARCGSPLLVVRGAWAPVEPEHGTVLVGVADDVDAGAARFAFEEAHRYGAQVWALHVSAVPELSGGLRAPPAERPGTDLRTLLESEAAVPRTTVAALREKFPEVGVRIDTVRGAAGALVEATRVADLVVITARHRHGRGLGPHTGSFTHALLHHAHCPVALVPVG
ncbi:nucleotide-binding universal stress UspA family protein [Streptomyces sp. SAI-208]|uniref:universal stress protein n=1 Tax=unclassified Streptomyces TaxID=2593676 RepID=UPI0024730B2A|nr:MULTISPECIES: universal stress protein [unclassified Streptomyces]MDH6514860.1 nucleotide-binding universal stress UspA family protein [Streptomyces sp. SAI-090]MDH6605707.1 nucleotide-binding universal stress UspA family protein [Streptomyces sp. SAI-208]MDH6621057.1 nucleotide-binding universal stress UspA family protein [Streptomyces sp. SAI-135]